MAATKNDSNKRKRPDPEKTQIKKPKSPNKGFDKSLKSSKNESPAAKKFNGFQKSSDNVEKSVPKTKKEARILAKELADARKKRRKQHFTLEQELASLWEKMRCRNISKEDRSKWISEALKKMKGKIPEIAGSHVSSRVLQTCAKYCSQEERNAVFEELQPQFLTLARNTYAVHLITKMLDNATKKQLADFISSLHGHVASLLRHMVGSVVVEHAYNLGNAAQKQAMLVELYSTELQLFKDLGSIKETRLVDIISKLQLQKASVSRHMTSVVQPILEKGIVDHSIIHRLLMEYITIADQSSAAEVIQQLSGPLLVRMIHTKDGSRIGMLCVKHGNAKERKKLVKGLKDHVSKIAHDRFGNMLLVSVLSHVDDTKLTSKVVIRELKAVLKEIIMDKDGRRPLLQLLHPNCSRYLSPDDLASLDLSIPSLCTKVEMSSELTEQKKASDIVQAEEDKSDSEEPTANKNPSSSELGEGGKKDPLVRRQELLINSGLAESLIDVCGEMAGELLVSRFGKEVLYEVATGGADGILLNDLDEKLHNLYEAVAALAAKPKSEGSEEEHLLENFHSSRTIRKLVLDCPSFASVFWENTLKGKCEMWAHGHSCKVITAFLESSDSSVRELAKEELQPLIDAGTLKLPDTKHTGEAN
ncbi:pumilio-like [Heracleum sosnowskyi]|uniref:Pumilio-like n=1 Tax=Heracleum sosnowskyi TaxID=360622 RepID=A0AAD8I7V1_9APIA|nr:pumilio-like [Heracleum sosnowskyi]